MAGCHAAPPPLVLPEDLPWRSFRYVDAAVGDTVLRRVSLVVPTRFREQGPLYDLHLDLGANGLGAFGVPFLKFAPDSAHSDSLTLTGRVAALGNRDDSTGAGPTSARIGTLGVVSLERSPVLIDLERQRVAVLPAGARLPQALDSAITWAPLHYRNGRVFLPVSFGTETRSLFLDTGSSLVPLWLDNATWGKVTREGAAATVGLPAVPRTLSLARRPLRDVPRVGTIALGVREAWTMTDGPPLARFAEWPFPLDGLVGLGAFRSQLLVLDIRRARLGVY